MTPAPASNRRLQGDLDCNAAIEARDGLIVRIAAGVPANACAAASSDVNCDGDTDTADALDVLLYVARVPIDTTADCPRVGTIAR
ncbi:MAG TPA: hypothetical protein VLS25_01645 [Dehalococcoidia bacterium]|nr:hypothetical protein [Dehalococcoidia bacterium]